MLCLKILVIRTNFWSCKIWGLNSTYFSFRSIHYWLVPSFWIFIPLFKKLRVSLMTFSPYKSVESSTKAAFSAAASFVSFPRPKSLKDILVRTKLRGPEWILPASLGSKWMQPYGKPRRQICRLFLVCIPSRTRILNILIQLIIYLTVIYRQSFIL